jgi:PKD repeat protein
MSRARKFRFSLFFCLFLSFGFTKLYATALSGTYTICATGCSYSDFDAAITDLNTNGISGPVVFNVSAGTYTSTSTLNSITGSSGSNTISFIGAGMYSTVWQSTGQTLDLNYSQNVLFKGITILTTSSTYAAAYIIYPSNVIFNQCRFVAPNLGTSASSYCIRAFYMNNCTISSCRFEGGNYSLYHYGYTTTGLGNNNIINNRVVNYGVSGFFEQAYGQSGNVFSGNSFDSCQYSYNPTAISINYDNGVTVSSNNIYNAGLSVLNINRTSSAKQCSFINNFIIPGPGVSTNGLNMSLDSGNVLIAHNTVFVPASVSVGTGVSIISYNKNVSVLSNIFDIEGSAVNTIVIKGRPANYKKIDGNDYYTSSGKLTGLSFLGYSYTSFTLLVSDACVYGFEKNAKNLKPTFLSSTDLHLSKSASNPIGVYAGVDADIDGDLRCRLFPSAGADESGYGKSSKPSSQVIHGPVKIFDGNPTVFTDSSAPSTVTYTWYVDGKYAGDSSSLQTTLIKSPSAIISLVTQNCGGKDSSYRSFTVSYPSAAPVSDFIADRNKISTNDSITLTDLSSNAPSSWKWKISPDSTYDPSGARMPAYRFIYGTNAASQNPQLHFYYSGNYTVCLTASNNLSSSKKGTGNTECKSAYIKVYQGTNMGSASLLTQPAGYIYDEGGPDDFYSNTTNTLQSLTIDACADSTYLVFNSFAINCNLDFLRIYDGKDNKGKLLNKCTSTGIGFSGLGPGYTGGYTSCSTLCIPATGAKADTFKAGKQMYIEFAMAAGFSGPGFSAFYWTKAAKTSKPTARFITDNNAHGDTACAGETLTFTNMSLGNNLSYFWDFDGSLSDGFESTKKDPSYGYLYTGDYVVTLVVNSCSGTDTFRKTIHVIIPPKPVASFTVDNTKPTMDDIVFLKPTIVTCVGSYAWTITKTYLSATDTGSAVFVNNTSSSNAAPAVMFTDTGYYTVGLSASSVSGTGSIIKKAIVYVRESYCSPYVSTLNSDLGISRVIFNGIDNSSAQGNKDYISYVNSGISAYVQQGFSYPITIKRDSAFVSAETRAVYIDLNQDGNFVKMAEDVDNAKNATWRTSIKIPSNTRLGATVMRIAANYSSDTNIVCGGNVAGEYEDYRIYIIADTVRPVITLSGPDTMTLELGYTFVDTGMYSARSSSGINLNPKVKITNPVVKCGGFIGGICLKLGWNIINYDVTDSLGNKAITKYRYVYVLPDTMRPNLVVTGPDTLYIAAQNDPNAYISVPKIISSEDLVDGTTLDTVSIVKIPLNKLDTVLVKYSTADQSGNRTIVYRWVIVIDSSAPVLVLRGPNPAKVQVDSSYMDAGVDPIDDFFDVPHLKPLVVLSGSVDIHKVGTYTLTYNLTNPYGLKAKPVTRTVEVIDTIRPVITLNGPAYDSVEVFEKYTDKQASATDNYYSTVSITDGGSFYKTFSNSIPTRLGTYVAIYTATDSSGNTASVSRTIKVFDSVAPVVKLIGPVVDTICRWAAYTDLGVLVTDNYYTRVKVDSEGDFSGTNLPGLYKLRYKATDSSGNTGYSEYRYIYVRNANEQGCLTGIKDGLSLDNYVSIYPNPTSGLLHISANLPQHEQISIRITDAVGKELSLDNRSTGMNTFDIDLGGQPAGIYTLSISTAKTMMTKQIVLTK